MVEDAETMVCEGRGIGILRRLARISRGAFNPIIIGEEWIKEEKAIPGIPKYSWWE